SDRCTADCSVAAQPNSVLAPNFQESTHGCPGSPVAAHLPSNFASHMTKTRAASLALVTPAPSFFDAQSPAGYPASSDPSDRRIHARLTPGELKRALTARLKYGDAVTLVDLSAGGALVETSKILRPDTDLVLEILDSRTHNVTQVVSRVLRSQVAALGEVVTYRGA